MKNLMKKSMMLALLAGLSSAGLLQAVTSRYYGPRLQKVEDMLNGVKPMNTDEATKALAELETAYNRTKNPSVQGGYARFVKAEKEFKARYPSIVIAPDSVRSPSASAAAPSATSAGSAGSAGSAYDSRGGMDRKDAKEEEEEEEDAVPEAAAREKLPMNDELKMFVDAVKADNKTLKSIAVGGAMAKQLTMFLVNITTVLKLMQKDFSADVITDTLAAVAALQAEMAKNPDIKKQNEIWTTVKNIQNSIIEAVPGYYAIG